MRVSQYDTGFSLPARLPVAGVDIAYTRGGSVDYSGSFATWWTTLFRLFSQIVSDVLTADRCCGFVAATMGCVDDLTH